jgi:glycosyltransferase involved in cell wall biosynthesis
VVAYGAGGATETIIENLNGVLFPQQTVDSLIQAIEKCESTMWHPRAIRKNAQRYDIHVFQDRLLDFLYKVSPAMWETPLLQRRAG